MAKFLYTDGANYKYEFSAKAPAGLAIGEEITYEELGYTEKTFFGKGKAVSSAFDQEVDHNIVELQEYEIGDLPDDWWDVIEKHYPKYHQSDEILWNDILCKYVTNEEMDKSDKKKVKDEYGTMKLAKKAYDEHCVYLYTEALKNKDSKEAGHEYLDEMTKERDTAVTASVIAYNLFDKIHESSSEGVMHTHDTIGKLAVNFVENHAHITEWEWYSRTQNCDDWEGCLVKWVKQRLKIN